MHSAAQADNPSIYPDLSYDTAKDFVEVATLGGQPNVLVVAPATVTRPWPTSSRRRRRSRVQLNFASAGTGSGTHINAEKFKLAAGIDVVHIPYKGTPEALTDTMTGRVTYFFSPISAALPNVREGKLVALGVSTAKRSSALPNVPTIAESGLAGLRLQPVGGHVRAGRHAAGDRRQDQPRCRRVLQTPEVQERLAALGAEAMPMTPAEFASSCAKRWTTRRRS